MLSLCDVLVCFAFIQRLLSEPGRKNKLTVQTSSGTVTGFVDKRHAANVRQFLGIPYAQPPIGDRRWRPPIHLGKDAGRQKIQAAKLPPSCPQYLSSRRTSIYTLDVLEFNLQGLNKTGERSEDCLKLSIWAPREQSRQSLLPVLIYVYGGAFSNGGINVPYQIPTQWVQRTQGHIVVSFNYRLNIFGFPNAKGLKDQNLGLLDQRLAVQWIHRNIVAFGGDPARLTLWGQSAGAQSVDFYNYAWHAEPLVSGLIMNSGTAFLPILSKDAAQSNFSFVADHFSCKNYNSTKQLSCMRKIPATEIELFLQRHAENRSASSLSFAPIVDDKMIFSNYANRAAAGNLSQIPAIIGTNAQDGVTLVPYPVSNPEIGINTTAAYQEELNFFFCPAHRTALLRQQAGQTTFRYYYNGNFSNIAPRYWQGAFHSSELPLLFGTFDDYRGQSTDLERETSHAMQDAWVVFARDGIDGLKSTGWIDYRLDQPTAREFGAGIAGNDLSIAHMEKYCT